MLFRSEFPLDAARIAAARAAAEAIVRGGGEAELPPRLAEDLARWEAGIAAHTQAERGDGLELWSALLAPERAYDQVGDALVVLDEPGELRQAACRVEDLELGRADLEDVFLNIMQGRTQGAVHANAEVSIRDRKSTRLNSSH